MTSPDRTFSDKSMLSTHEQEAAQEIEQWAARDTSFLSHALRIAGRPLEWAAERPEAEDVMKKINERIADFLGSLSDASAWTYNKEDVLAQARDEHNLQDVTTVEDLRPQPMNALDDLAQSYFNQNAVLSALEGGGTGLGGVAFVAADVPMLFAINLRMIQQIAASYGFRFDGPEARPLVLRIFSAAVADTPEARQDALDELRTAGAAIARDNAPTSRSSAGNPGMSGDGGDASSDQGTSTEENQSRVLVNEIARNMAARQMAQLIPLAGAATGAGLNYWFTNTTAETAYMLSRALLLQYRHQS